MEKLNVELILENIDEHDKDGTASSFKDGNVIINFFRSRANQNYLDYSEEDLNTNIVTNIQGDDINGFTKSIIDRNNPQIEIIRYYPSGNVNSIDYKYSDVSLKENSGNTEYPMGNSLVYNEDGSLLKTLNMDDVFKFSVVNVKELLSSKYTDLIFIGIEGIYDPDGSYWTIKYSTQNLGFCIMEIDAATGEILSDDHHITTIE